MKIIREFTTKQLEFINFMEANKFYIQEVTMFYSVYQILLNVLGMSEKDIKKRNNLYKKLIQSRKFDFKTYSKLKDYMRKDMDIINQGLNKLNSQLESSEYMGDFYYPGTIAISIHDS